jgi:hypothetical protein
MKKLLLFASIFALIFSEGFSQASFNTGAMEVVINEYGRIRLFTPDAVRHLQRASILVGTSPTTVFDYTNDADEAEPTVLVSNPAKSDFEIYGAYNNAYSSLPPDVLVKLNAYGWTSGSYVIVKFNITNNEANALNASVGLEVIPEINQTYGYDSVSWNAEAGVIRFHRGTQVNMGMKLLSASLSSLYSFEWYEDYSADTSLWNWMNYGMLQPLYASATADGPVSITSQSPMAIAPNASVNVYYAMALGANETAMLSNIAMAVEKYQAIITSVPDKGLSETSVILEKNTPNPFSGSTSIKYRLTEPGMVNLSVFNCMGERVAALVDERQTSGEYSVRFSSGNLPAGIYYYTLRFNDRSTTQKMVIGK